MPSLTNAAKNNDWGTSFDGEPEREISEFSQQSDPDYLADDSASAWDTDSLSQSDFGASDYSLPEAEADVPSLSESGSSGYSSSGATVPSQSESGSSDDSSWDTDSAWVPGPDAGILPDPGLGLVEHPSEGEPQVHDANAAPISDGRRRAQKRWVNVYKGILALLRPLKSTGSKLRIAASSVVGVGIIELATTAASAGLPVPTGLVAEITPEVELKGDMKATGVVGRQVATSGSLTFIVRIAASVLKKLGLSTGVGASLTFSTGGYYNGREHLAAKLTRKIRRVVKQFIRAGERVWKTLDEVAGGVVRIPGNIRRVVASAARRVHPVQPRGYGREMREGNDVEDLPNEVAEANENQGRAKTYIPKYKVIRDIARERRLKVRTLSLGADAKADAMLGLLGAKAAVSGTRYKYTRPRPFPSDYHGKGYKLHERGSSTGVKALAAFEVAGLTGKVKFVHNWNKVSPDYSGSSITVTLNGGAALVAELAGMAPTALAEITFTAGGSAITVLSQALSAPISRLLSGVGIDAGVTGKGQVTLEYYRTGELLEGHPEQFHLRYSRATFGGAAHIGLKGAPYAGVTAGGRIGAGFTAPITEYLGTSTMGYVALTYKAMKARASYKQDEWPRWKAKHRETLERMRSDTNVHQELTRLALSLANEEMEDAEDAAEAIQLREKLNHVADVAEWVHVFERLLDLQDNSRRAVDGVSPHYKKHATASDKAKWLKDRVTGKDSR